MISVAWEVKGAAKRVEFSLPICSNKFVQKVDMPQEAFDKFWKEYSLGSNAASHKLDVYLPNPAGTTISIHEVLKRVGGLLNTALGLKVIAVPDMNNIALLNGVG